MITLFHIDRITIRLHFTWFLLMVVIVLYSLHFPTKGYNALPLPTRIGVGLALGILLGIFILWHELAHAIVMRYYNISCASITLSYFGGLAAMEFPTSRPREEILIGIAGPLTSLTIACIFLAMALPIDSTSPVVNAILAHGCVVNGIMAVFNLIPCYPMDGGRICKGILWGWNGSPNWSQMWTSRLAIVMSLAMIIILGIWLKMVVVIFVGILLFFCAYVQAKKSRRRYELECKLVETFRAWPPQVRLAFCKLTEEKLSEPVKTVQQAEFYSLMRHIINRVRPTHLETLVCPN